ncbi:hypothetical protein [Fulvivirga ligni]|uniref:hypothetical protein n=1 Tax=Fulvivirga ligni TaxID=2904246 RepID=UPI001F2762C8|nr:hypothetical protein [Fulvivirga ligni]UII23155.1 hypothetical protein LVD16_07940 [Fulvivirga ligni]
MKLYYLPIVLSLFITHHSSAQELSTISGRKFLYDAYFINPAGDTLTKEVMEWYFQEEKSKLPQQKNLHFTYYTDTVGIKKFIHPQEKVRKRIARNMLKAEKKKAWANWTWLQKEINTGYTETDTSFWIHPPRGNQYIYCELSGMPGIEYNELKVGGNWSKTLLILGGYGDGNGKLISDYEVKKEVKYSKGGPDVDHCWLIEVTHTHSKLGQTSSQIVFDSKKYGFLEIVNNYYDGSKIVFQLREML